jgi:hypothetical protein
MLQHSLPLINAASSFLFVNVNFLDWQKWSQLHSAWGSQSHHFYFVMSQAIGCSFSGDPFYYSKHVCERQQSPSSLIKTSNPCFMLELE